jgi:hypothetical protein
MRLTIEDGALLVLARLSFTGRSSNLWTFEDRVGFGAAGCLVCAAASAGASRAMSLRESFIFIP